MQTQNQYGDKVVAVIEYHDGSIIDVVHNVLIPCLTEHLWISCKCLMPEKDDTHTQQQLQNNLSRVLVSITLNIPGPVKNSEAITAVFASVISELDEALSSFEKLHQEDFSPQTGMEFTGVPSRRRT